MSESALPASLAALRSQGAARFDPVRFHYLEVLSRRVAGASGEVRRILEATLAQAVVAHGERLRLDNLETAKADTEVAELSSHGSPLAELNQYIQQLTQDSGHPHHVPGRHSDAGPEAGLKSANLFRETWSKIAAEKQVDQALARGPENAGPLNAHMLVLHSLALMRKLSPDYLRRFLAQADALLWLDQVYEKHRLAAGKSGRQARARNK